MQQRIGTRALFQGAPRYSAETPWGAFGATLATALITIGPAVAVLAAISAIVAVSGPDSPLHTDPSHLSSLATPAGAAVAAGTQLVSLALVLAFAARGGAWASTLRLTGDRFTLPLYVTGAVLLLAITGAVELILYSVFKIDVFGDTAWLRDGLRSPLAWASVVIAVVLAPLWEELTFRGFFLSALAKTPLGFWGGAMISNVFWTLLHGMYSWAGLVSVFIAGLILTWLVRRTGSVLPAIAAHAAGNAVALAFTYFFAPVAG